MLTTITTELIIGSAAENPLDGVTPNIDVFGIEFKSAFQLILGGIWALALFLVTAAFLWNLAKWGVARQRGHSDDIADGADGAKRSGVAFGAVAGASVIIGGILALTNMAGA
ncbi:hypothetical protein [Arthrobacter sp. SD76]